VELVVNRLHPKLPEPTSAVDGSGDDFVTCEVWTFAGTLVIQAPDVATMVRYRDEMLMAITRTFAISGV
jgi:hypothetical protein